MRTMGVENPHSDIVQDDAEDDEPEYDEEDEADEGKDLDNEDEDPIEGESPKRKKKRKRSHRCKTWDDESTRKLISEYREKYEKMEEYPDRNSKENRRLWKGIAKRLRKIGYSFSVKGVQARWDALEADYMEMASRNVHPGLKRVTCPFGRELTAILNPGGMKNYLQIEEEVRKDKEREAKSEQEKKANKLPTEGPPPEGPPPDAIVINEAVNKDKADDTNRGSVCVIDHTNRILSSPKQNSPVRPPSERMERPPVICTTVDLKGVEDGPMPKTPRVELPASLRRNIVLQKSDNYTEIVQSEPVPSSPGPSKSANEDMLLGIACQLHRHLVHHQPSKSDPKKNAQTAPEGQPSEGTSKDKPEVADEVDSSDRAKTICFLETVIEKLMVEKEKKLVLLEERNAIDRERVSLERSKMHLMEQLIALVHTNRRS